MTLIEILQGANVALHVIQARVVVVLCMLLTFAIFCWAMWLQTQLGAIIAAAFALLVFLPVLYTGGKHGIEAKREHPADEAGVAPRPNARAA
jgi:hypothetical protein